MSSELSFFTPISNSLTNDHEKYHNLRYCDKLFDFGQQSVHIVNVNEKDIEIAKDNLSEKDCPKFAGYLLKSALIATIILPAIALTGKCIYRRANRFSVKPSNSDSEVGNIALITMPKEQKSLTQIQESAPLLSEKAEVIPKERMPGTTLFAHPDVQRKEKSFASFSITVSPLAKPLLPRVVFPRGFETLTMDTTSICLRQFLSLEEEMTFFQTSKAIYGSQVKKTCRNITDDRLRILAKLLPHLTTLNLLDCRLLKDNSLLLLPFFHNLEHLKLCNFCEMTDSGFGYLDIYSDCRKLKSIRLEF